MQNNCFQTSKWTSAEPDSPGLATCKEVLTHRQVLCCSIDTGVEEIAQSCEQLGESSHCQSLSALADLKRELKWKDLLFQHSVLSDGLITLTALLCALGLIGLEMQ